MINLSNPHYWEETAILRATQAWESERKTETQVAQNYQVFLEQVKRELSDLYAQFGIEGLLDYSVLTRRLNATQLAQYRTMIQNIINQNLDIDDEDLLLELEKLAQYSNLNILDSRLNILEAFLLVLVNRNIETVSDSLSETFTETYNHTLYDIHRKTGYVSPFERVNDEKVEEVLAVAWTGYTFRDAIKHNRHNFNRDLRKEITQGIRRNTPYQKLIARLANIVSGGKGYKSIRSILRGETTRIIVEATAQTYRQNGVEQYQFIATLDNRTTHICRSLDGKVFNMDDLEIGVNASPMHYGCRSCIAPYFPEDDLSELKRTARNSSTGQNYKVNAGLTYKEWNEKFNH